VSDPRREARRKYEGDVFYDVWRSGRGDPDAIDWDRVDDMRHDGVDADEAAASEVARMTRGRGVEENRHDDSGSD